ncbi:hypothetical protein EHM76_03025, partial [bacterium]
MGADIIVYPIRCSLKGEGYAILTLEKRDEWRNLMSSGAEDIKFRPLRDLEEGTCMRFKMSGGQNPVMLTYIPYSLNFSICARVRGPLSQEAIRSALDRLCIRHPLLAVRAAVGEDVAGRFTTEGVPKVCLRVVERRSNDDWVGKVAADIQQPSNYTTGPLFRCIWLRGEELSDLILLCDHITSDGRSAIVVLRDFLTLLADPGCTLPPLAAPALAELVPAEMVALAKEAAARRVAG